MYVVLTTLRRCLTARLQLISHWKKTDQNLETHAHSTHGVTVPDVKSYPTAYATDRKPSASITYLPGTVTLYTCSLLRSLGM